MRRRFTLFAAATVSAGCVFGGFEETQPFVGDVDMGTSEPDMTGTDATTEDTGRPMPAFDVVETEGFGATVPEGASVGFGPIPDGFSAVELVSPGRARAHVINYDGSSSDVLTNDIVDMIPGGLEAASPTFDAVIDDTGFFYTVSVTSSERTVTRCTFSTRMCVDRYVSGFIRGSDLAMSADPDGSEVGFLTNDDGAGVVIGAVTRNPFEATATGELTGDLSSDSVSFRIGGGVSQLAWIDATNQVYQTARWRAGSFAGAPGDCGSVQSGQAQIEPVGASGTVLFLQAGELLRSACRGEGSTSLELMGEDSIVRFDLSHSANGDELLAWQTSSDEVFAARFDPRSFALTDVTSLGPVANVDGLRAAISADDSRMAVLVWGDQLKAFILRPQ